MALSKITTGSLADSAITADKISAGGLYWDTSGNVGIGTSSPSYKLEVKGAAATAGQLSIHDGTGDTVTSGNNAGSLLFQARDSSIRTIAEIDAIHTTTNGTGGAMVFQTRVSDTLAERMRIDSSGAVTLSTALPVASGGTGLTSIAHTVQVFTSGSGTYTTPANVKAIWVRCVGGGGGGGSNGASGQNAGTGGGTTTFSTLSALGGAGGYFTATGGSASGGDINCSGGSTGVPGNSSPLVTQAYGGAGGSSVLGGGGSGGSNGGQAGYTPTAGYGGGGGGCGTSASYLAMAGGAGAGYTEKLINSPSATYSYAVGAAGAGGTGGGTGGGVGGNGTAGLIIVTEYYV